MSSRAAHYRQIKRDLKDIDINEPKDKLFKFENSSATQDNTYYSFNTLCTTTASESSTTTSDQSEPLNSKSFSEDEICLSNEDSSIEPNLRMNIKEAIHAFAVETGCSHVVLNNLLRKLHDFHPELPFDARTLLKKETISTITTKLDNGVMIYFGLLITLEKFLQTSKADNSFALFINVDGLPLTESGNKEFWPIMCRVGDSVPLIVGVFCGQGKPSPVEKFLEPLVAELETLKSTPEMTVERKKIRILKVAFVCDAPARSYLKGTIGHNGTFACDRCHVQGQVYERTMSFTEMNSRRRTHADFFRYKSQNDGCESLPLSVQNHIKKTSMLVDVIDMVKDFPQDIMHVIFQGVVRRMLMFLTSKIPTKLSRRDITSLNNRINDLSHQFPIELERKPRPLSVVEKYKAAEFKTFLFFVGPIVFWHFAE